jgi:hypothetical protein
MAMTSVFQSTASPSGQIDRLLCGLRGHFMLLRFEPHKLSLHCALCGHESTGWEIGERPLHSSLAERPAPNRREGRLDRRVPSPTEVEPASALGT